MNPREQFLLTIVGIPLATVVLLGIGWTAVSIWREYRWRTRDDHRLDERRISDAVALAAYDKEAAK